MSEKTAAAARRRVDEGLGALRAGLAPYVEKHMRDRHGEGWRRYASRAARGDSAGPLDVQALLKTLLDNWGDLFRHDERLRKARSFIFLALDARNAVAHFAGEMEARAALRHLDAIRALLAAIGAEDQMRALDRLYEAQLAADGEPAPGAARGPGFEEPPPPERPRAPEPAASAGRRANRGGPMPRPGRAAPAPAAGRRANRGGPMREAAARGKYAPLHRHLSARPEAEWRASFGEIEAVLGFRLPDSARRHRAWWANQRKGGGHGHALAWRAAGWRASAIDLEAETLVFRRREERIEPVDAGAAG